MAATSAGCLSRSARVMRTAYGGRFRPIPPRREPRVSPANARQRQQASNSNHQTYPAPEAPPAHTGRVLPAAAGVAGTTAEARATHS